MVTEYPAFNNNWALVLLFQDGERRGLHKQKRVQKKKTKEIG